MPGKGCSANSLKKAPSLVLHFPYYTLMTFLMMFYVILLSVLMILSVIKHLICGNNWIWFLNLNLIYETLWSGAGSGVLISMLEKHGWFGFTSLITLKLLL